MQAQDDFNPKRPSPLKADDIRAYVCHSAELFGMDDWQVDPSIRWAVIAWLESAWAELKHKERERNRRSVLKFLFGHDSTKSLADGTIQALAVWSRSADNPAVPLAEIRVCLTAALVEAGQAALPLDVEA